MDNNYQNQNYQNQNNFDPTASQQQNGYQWSPYQQPIQPEEEEQPKKKRGFPKWFTRIILGVLIVGIAYGGGYAGAKKAYEESYRNLDRIVVERVETTAEAVPAPEAGTAVMTSQQIAEATAPSVVAIMTERMTTSNFWFGQQVSSGAGSGVIISADGYIITCAHVIEGADTIQVQLSDDTVHEAKLIGKYIENDIAVIKIEAEGLVPAKIADSSTVVQGETVYAVGNPEGRFSGSITDGLISATDRNIQMQMTVYNDDEEGTPSRGQMYGWPFYSYGSGDSTSIINTVINVFQTSAPVSPGNSGGGLFNERAELIGIVNAKSSSSSTEGLGFAIPINKGMEIAEALMTEGVYTPPAVEETPAEESAAQQLANKAMLGIRAGVLTAEQAAQYGYTSGGVYIVEITEQATIDAGLAVGDRIISIDDTIVNAVTDVTGYLADKAPGEIVTVTVERSGKMHRIEVTLLENPDAAE